MNGSFLHQRAGFPVLGSLLWFAFLFAGPAIAEEREAFRFTYSEWGEARTDYTGRSPIDPSWIDHRSWSSIGPVRTSILLERVDQEHGQGWFSGDAAALWLAQLDLLWAGMEQDEQLLERYQLLVDADPEARAPDGSRLSAAVTELQDSIARQHSLHREASGLTDTVEVLGRVLSALDLYAHDSEPLMQVSSGADWSSAYRQTDQFGTIVFDTDASATGRSRAILPDGSDHYLTNFTTSTRLFVLRYDPADMTMAVDALSHMPDVLQSLSAADWPATVIAPFERGQAYIWFARFFEEGLGAFDHVLRTLSPLSQSQLHVPESALQSPASDDQSDAFGFIDIPELDIQEFGIPEIDFSEPPTFGAPEQTGGVQGPDVLDPRLENPFSPDRNLAGAASAAPPDQGVLMRLDMPWNPHVEFEFSANGSREQYGVAGLASTPIDGIYRPWDDVLGLAIPLGPERFGAPTGVGSASFDQGLQATNLTSDDLQLPGGLHLRGDVPGPHMSGRFINSTPGTQPGETFRTGLEWSIAPVSLLPPPAPERMDLRLVRFDEGTYVPIEGPREYGDHFIVEGRLQEPSDRSFYVIDMSFGGEVEQRILLEPTEEDPRILRSDFHYFVWETDPSTHRE